MSQSGTPIGSARIDFTGNTQQLEAAAARAQTVTKDAVAKAEASSASAAQNENVEQAVKVTKLISVAALMLRAADELSKGIQGFSDAAGKLAEGFKSAKEGLTFDLGKSSGIEGELDAITKRYNEARAKIDADRTAAYQGVAGLGRRAIEEFNGTVGAEFDEQLKQVETAYAGALKQYEALALQRSEIEAQARVTATRVKQAEMLTKLQEESIQLNRAFLTEEEQINEAVENRLADIRDLKEARKDDAAFVKALEDTERRLNDYRAKALEKIVAEQEKAAKKVADAYQRAMDSALKSIEGRVASMFDPNRVDSGVGTIIQKLDIIAQQLRRQT